MSLALPSSLDPEDFSYLKRENNLGPQLSFLGSPIYFFTPDDNTRGNVNGEGGAGETFFSVKPQ
ncbi:hypothetical protein [Robertkochia solimangrovi]|uniref:hypothetical protein n=1 Tax=Robertkochia solimangrovi TaxID=2213046 RepID=UPI00117CC45F|nr:hypothetical protein [Robertkochia solimangrovi]TRZ46158.1 hypothetical protein DMZ48_02550 [Robertkochia solimangrovi]